MAKGKSEVAVQGSFGIVESDHIPDYIKDAQRGSENVGTEDIAIPRLEIVQALSPSLSRNDPKYIEGAKTGDLTNSVTRTNYGSEVVVCPIHFVKQWLVWRDKKKGGGFYGAFQDEPSAQARAQQEGGANAGIESVDTPQHLCILLGPNGPEEIMIPLARTKAKVSRSWNAMIRLTGGDRFGRVYTLKTVEEKNDKGTFFNYVVTPRGFPSKELYARAESMYMQIAAGEKKVVMHVDEDANDQPQGEM